jgi:branched-chain amino acid transport system ATP-binding protein
MGQPIHGLDPDAVARRGLVLVPEGRQVFPFLTVAENLRMGAELDVAAMVAVLVQAAQDGVPFCEECARAAAAQQQAAA